MARKTYVIYSLYHLGSQTWRTVLEHVLSRSDQVRFRLPGEDLEENQPQILQLPGVAVTPWSGMKGAQVASSLLTPEARALLTTQRLWSYELAACDQPLLRVEDFSLCLLWATEAELVELKSLGIGEELLHVADLEPSSEPGVQAATMTEGQLGDLRRELERATKQSCGDYDRKLKDPKPGT